MGTSKNRNKKHPGIGSKIKKVPSNLDWGEGDRNTKHLKKIEKAIQEEDEFRKDKE